MLKDGILRLPKIKTEAQLAKYLKPKKTKAPLTTDDRLDKLEKKIKELETTLENIKKRLFELEMKGD